MRKYKQGNQNQTVQWEFMLQFQSVLPHLLLMYGSVFAINMKYEGSIGWNLITQNIP